jgi:hypothetical protein
MLVLIFFAPLMVIAYFSIQMRRVSPEAPAWWRAAGWRLKVLFDPGSLNDRARRYRKLMLTCLAVYCAALVCLGIAVALLGT